MSVKIIVAASCAALFIAPPLAQTQRDPIEQAARAIHDMNRKGVARKDPPPPPTATSDDFYGYLPQHEYVFVPTRTLWPDSLSRRSSSHTL